MCILRIVTFYAEYFLSIIQKEEIILKEKKDKEVRMNSTG